MSDIGGQDPAHNKPSQAEGSDSDEESVSPSPATDDKPSQAEGEDDGRSEE